MHVFIDFWKLETENSLLHVFSFLHKLNFENSFCFLSILSSQTSFLVLKIENCFWKQKIKGKNSYQTYLSNAKAFAAYYLFSFWDLHLLSFLSKNIKNKVWRDISTSLCKYQDHQDYWPIIHDKFEDLFTTITHSFQDFSHKDICTYITS